MAEPILIVMTPVRNEAWVLKAFLTATSIWADFIIIADQNSTDDSKEIALSFPKVILIENLNVEYNEDERQKLLIDRARKINGDKILFGLDADEIFSANFRETADWGKILNSSPGDVFWIKWAEIRPDLRTFWESEKTYFPWVFHDDNIEPHKNYVRNMHSMRIPYPIEEQQMYFINEFRVLHLAYLNMYRVIAKLRFYKFVDWKLNNSHFIKLSRSYTTCKKEPILEMNFDYINFQTKYGFDVFDKIDFSSGNFWFNEYIITRLEDYSLKSAAKLDIWDKDFVDEYSLKDPRRFWMKVIHWYLKITQAIKDRLIVKTIDKALKFLIA